MKNISPYRQMLSMFLLAVGFDQLSKDGARVLGLYVLYNSGVSFSILSNVPAQLLTLSTLGVLVFLWYFLQEKWLTHPIAAGIFFGAGVSNIFDRIVYGGVRDWLPLFGTKLHNNLADWFIFGSIIFFAVATLKGIRATK